MTESTKVNNNENYLNRYRFSENIDNILLNDGNLFKHKASVNNID